jgi:hypothetical protein
MKIALTRLRIKQVCAAASLKSLLTLPLAIGAAFCAATPALASPIFGQDLASFAVLGASGVTNVPTSTIGGNLGTAPSASAGGGYVFTSGSMQANTALAQQAQLDLDAATVTINSMGPGTLLGADLTGTINPGVYTVSAGGTNLSGDLILDGGGSNSAVWVFVFPSTLITSSTSNVFVTNVGDGANVGIYWSVASAATLNGATFAGNVLAHDLISSDGYLTIGCGRLLSATSQVTLIQDTVSLGCAGFENSGGFDQGVDIGSGGNVVRDIPEPGSLALLGLGLAAFGLTRRRKQ